MIKIAASGRSILLRLKLNAVIHSRIDAPKTVSRSTIVMPPNDSGVIVADAPNTKKMFEIFEPSTLPIAISALPFNAETTLVASSGSDVPPANNVIAITDSLTPNARATSTALVWNRFPPNTNAAKPPTIIMIINHIGVCFCTSTTSSPSGALAEKTV